jgi:nucleoside-diphosphate-sugar epimerase
MEERAKPGGTVLVTGGSGFVAGWCVVELLRRGYDVRTTVRDSSREEEVRAAVASQVDPEDRLTFFGADLSADDGWDSAIAGCDFVLHVASPFPAAAPDDPDEVIVPARDGALRVLRSALRSGVRRIVLTSSSATVAEAPEPRPWPLTEEVWTDLAGARPYVQSKVIAERAAWDFVAREGGGLELAVVNPVGVFGPVLGPDYSTSILPSAILGPVLTPDLSYSVQAVERLLNRSMPGVPRLGFSFVDVRDVADIHLRGMTAPQAAGERFLAAGTSLWLSDVARILRERLGSRAAKVPTRRVPSFMVRAAARFDPEVRQIVGQLGKRSEFSSEKARTRLGWSPRPVEDTIVDCAESLLGLGVVKV